MESFNNRLEVGMLAMVIGCTNPDYIGSIVTVEEFVKAGLSMNQHFEGTYRQGVRVVAPVDCVRVSGFSGGATTAEGYNSKPGVGFFYHQHLMPLPPLGDEQLQKETEKELENA